MDMPQFVKYSEIIEKHLHHELNHFAENLQPLKDDPTFNLKDVLISFVILGLQNEAIMLKKPLEQELKEGEYGRREHPRY